MSRQPQQRRFDGRRADLAAIHIAKKALHWSDDEYRDIMATVCGGVRSAGDLDYGGRKRFLAHLQACARANAAPQPAHKPVDRRRDLDMSGPMGKAWSLWMELADAGQVKHRTMQALEAYATRQTQVARLEWLNAAQQHLVVESLKRWLKRL